ncbi:MAG: methylated-DNA--[protein]-cysteine S-methyltransferase [Leptospiraceae bacterium]|nr:methylated-DNA--[protein]-cysteine S-methyltransferase [Leptospiraceae bacterium]MCK6382055.1 methylated-DNA--[protein]-cysteine S-methyltransferase [Leptospiraceae bacterium]NUM41013.1 methylated-DNA--[protein]-cysteine S-methyltransferase [Leptospiraceae bacterium]
MSNFYKEVYKVTKKIPKGKISTYGRIAVILGKPRAARAVGYALHVSKDDTIPWQRVINSKGQISFKGDTVRYLLQKEILSSEGIEFDENNTVDLKKYGWP